MKRNVLEVSSVPDGTGLRITLGKDSIILDYDAVMELKRVINRLSLVQVLKLEGEE